MKFYDCSTAPSPRRVRIFIAEKKLEIEIIEIDMRKGEQLTPEFRKINPNCTVPVLETDDGNRLLSTAGIRHYLEASSPEPSLLGSAPSERGKIADIQWRIENDGFMAMAEALRNTAPGLKNRALTGPFDYEQIPALGERGKVRVGRFFDQIEELIGTKPFVAGDKYSVADIDLLVLVDFARWLKISLPDSAENAKRWYTSVSDRPSAKL